MATRLYGAAVAYLLDTERVASSNLATTTHELRSLLTMDPLEIVMELHGMPITARDIACYVAIAGSMPHGIFDQITSKLTDEDERKSYTVAYDKAKLAYNEVLGELDE
jgi:hypothetical protein